MHTYLNNGQSWKIVCNFLWDILRIEFTTKHSKLRSTSNDESDYTTAVRSRERERESERDRENRLVPIFGSVIRALSDKKRQQLDSSKCRIQCNFLIKIFSSCRCVCLLSTIHFWLMALRCRKLCEMTHHMREYGWDFTSTEQQLWYVCVVFSTSHFILFASRIQTRYQQQQQQSFFMDPFRSKRQQRQK